MEGHREGAGEVDGDGVGDAAAEGTESPRVGDTVADGDGDEDADADLMLSVQHSDWVHLWTKPRYRRLTAHKEYERDTEISPSYDLYGSEKERLWAEFLFKQQ